MPTNGATRGASLQAEAPELAAIPDKAGQKRRGVLLEVDGNRKSRRSSREDAKGAAANPADAKKTKAPSTRLLRSQNREMAKEKPSKASASSFQIYHDPVPTSSAVQPKAGSSGLQTKNQTEPIETSAPTSRVGGAAVAKNSLDTSATSNGGWEVLQVQHSGAQAPAGDHAASVSDTESDESTGKGGEGVETEEEMKGGKESADADVEAASPDKIAESASDEEIPCSVPANVPTASQSVEQVLGANEVGKEMLEGEEALAIVKDVMSSEMAEIGAANGAASASTFDIDSDDRMDEFCVTEYSDEIYSYLRQNETRSMVDPDYMSRQLDINAKMRVILNDWLVEVHLKFKLRQETLYLCFQLIDRFLEITGVQRQKLQLVGVTGLMLASKYEEIYPPEVRDYVYICDNAYTRDEILKMEQTMLATLQYRLSLPTVWCFMKRYTKAAGRQVAKPDSFFHLMSYLIELSMIQIRMLRFKPSTLVAASIYLTNTLRDEAEPWTEQLQHHTKYSIDDLEPCVAEFRSLIADASKEQKYKAVFKKFCHRQFDTVALLPALDPPATTATEPSDQSVATL